MRLGFKGIVVALAIVGAVPVAAEMDTGEIREMSERISTLVDADADRLIAIFKDIHQNPELGFMETRTARIVASELETLGYEVKTGIGGTGVVGFLRNGPGPVVMWRADMDANAIREHTGLPYASDVRVTNFAG